MARALVLVALLLAAPSVLAQGRDPAAAEALFTEGRKAFVKAEMTDPDGKLLAEAHGLMVRLLPGQP